MKVDQILKDIESVKMFADGYIQYCERDLSQRGINLKGDNDVDDYKDYFMEDGKSDPNKKKLEVCPFCGEEESLFLVEDEQDNSVVRCEYCGAKGPVAETASQARSEWNRRK